MFDKLIESIYISESMQDITFWKMTACLGAALLLGLLVSFTYTRCAKCSRSFALSLVIIPAAVNCIILLVNGNLGMSIAVVGTFSLVRFRSVQGSAFEITSILVATSVGLACGVGYLWMAVLFAVLLCAVMLVLHFTRFAEGAGPLQDLRILVPESMNYCGAFDDIFSDYTDKNELIKSKTTAMGSMYELTYEVKLKDPKKGKDMMDALRIRNGNLPVTLSIRRRSPDEL